MSQSQQIFVDTSFFKALLDTKDEFHASAVRTWKFLDKQSSAYVTTNYVLDETMTLLRAQCGLNVALKFRQILYDYASQIQTIRVTVDDESHAWEWFTKDWSKLSFTDCVSFAVMKRLQITTVATFDEHFFRAGFIRSPPS